MYFGFCFDLTGKYMVSYVWAFSILCLSELYNLIYIIEVFYVHPLLEKLVCGNFIACPLF